MYKLDFKKSRISNGTIQLDGQDQIRQQQWSYCCVAPERWHRRSKTHRVGTAPPLVNSFFLRLICHHWIKVRVGKGEAIYHRGTKLKNEDVLLGGGVRIKQTRDQSWRRRCWEGSFSRESNNLASCISVHECLRAQVCWRFQSEKQEV